MFPGRPPMIGCRNKPTPKSSNRRTQETNVPHPNFSATLARDSRSKEENITMRFSPSGMSTIGIFVVVSMIAVAVPMLAQSLPATPHTPDLLGIYPGMPMNSARAQLQQRSSKYQVASHTIAEHGFGLTIPDPTDQDQVDVYLT